MWAIDETFDAGHGSVIVGANEFQNTNHIRAISSKTSGSVLHSPEYLQNMYLALVFRLYLKDEIYTCIEQFFKIY